jgi:hypothetical protein
MKTETVMEPLASDRQMAYIRRLRVEVEHGIPGPETALSSAEASRLIETMLGKSIRNGVSSANAKINEPRLGMAMKERFRVWVGLGRDIWDDQNRRQQFVERVLQTYELFTEIAEKCGGQTAEGQT